jgi:hypothetical protein
LHVATTQFKGTASGNFLNIIQRATDQPPFVLEPKRRASGIGHLGRFLGSEFAFLNKIHSPDISQYGINIISVLSITIIE